ncbi:ubiquinol-cytochrome c reductase, iron-sulfur subunit [Plasmodium yoelii 17X]|uniref:Ubiquinol-cytochrome c reductase, iron-sulfur subunit, putative n=4 Tax=Plasmodium yoelii TaxID=5861 RepID=Q7RCZ2_PLAYO|nr:cytochrome b-c1 complex subunit Rieske, putative [Plasmodium yoelii]EAA17685.1 ubiquinol-cytochrome c reductase, iron-sulfur subunit, putative [Plasmodium yoelii yoelii]ETB56336.1 ubiquinol-cytochrome c reductase, iron-sulfur subunit [Plasmodium yoelii 17X]WBY59723.1 cytochrome b-c1 complex subunit Rieske [Plasmodium yoelii yoelii]CDU19692.1 ubiquinol-cytochrome c reductase iron-sulfur subunit, putative [Plasmodium yoelii]VTZ80449.1 cytochrome b-c1 complex subunit Rieske, putative [Plasmodi|eukprot:XP_726120.1 cytochrome b-c1 complex subunit Rieske, putative [Plasmodium yoelii]
MIRIRNIALISKNNIFLRKNELNKISQRYFGGTFNHNIKENERVPPASENPGYKNLFDHAEDIKLWEIEEKENITHKKVDDLSELVEPSNHPHQYEGIFVRTRYAHYNQTAEPVFPRKPDLEKGELASGANVTRTDVWHNPNEPAIVSVGKFEPNNFRPAGYIENAPNPDSINSDYHPDFREYRLRSGNADRRTFMYFISASYFFIMSSIMRSTICKAVHFFWISKDLVAEGTTELDMRTVGEGEQVVIKWRGKPIFVKHRTPEDIQRAREDDKLVETMRDPQLDSDRTIRPEWLVNIGVCTHLGCIPAPGGNYNGYFCPCHGSHYDNSGRIRQGPAPANLEVPPYEFVDENTIKIG